MKAWHVFLLGMIPAFAIIWMSAPMIFYNVAPEKISGQFLGAYIIVGGMALSGHYMIRNMKPQKVLVFGIVITLLIAGLTYLTYVAEQGYSIVGYLVMAGIVNVISFAITLLRRRVKLQSAHT